MSFDEINGKNNNLSKTRELIEKDIKLITKERMI